MSVSDVAVLALTAQLHAGRAQLLLAAGFPADLTRDPTPAEVASRTTFAGLESDVNGAAGRLAALAVRARTEALDLIAAQLTALAPQGPAAVVAYLDALAARAVVLPGVLDLYAANVPAMVAELDGLARRAAARALADAAASGSPRLPVDAVNLDASVAGEQARRVASEAVDAAVRATRGTAYATARLGVEGSVYVARVVNASRDVGTKGLADVAAQSALVTNGSARNATFEVLEPADGALVLYASELLDRNTCTPCAGVDGKRYASRSEAEGDYPSGRYVGCRGGDRCRGTLIAVHDETPATLQRPLPTAVARRAREGADA